jgi:hypothetical protein
MPFKVLFRKWTVANIVTECQERILHIWWDIKFPKSPVFINFFHQFFSSIFFRQNYFWICPKSVYFDLKSISTTLHYPHNLYAHSSVLLRYKKWGIIQIKFRYRYLKCESVLRELNRGHQPVLISQYNNSIPLYSSQINYMIYWKKTNSNVINIMIFYIDKEGITRSQTM